MKKEYTLIFIILFGITFQLSAQKKNACPISSKKFIKCSKCKIMTDQLFETQKNHYCIYCSIKKHHNIISKKNKKKYFAHTFTGTKKYICKACQKQIKMGYFLPASKKVYCFQCAGKKIAKDMQKKRIKPKRKLQKTIIFQGRGNYLVKVHLKSGNSITGVIRGNEIQKNAPSFYLYYAHNSQGFLNFDFRQVKKITKIQKLTKEEMSNIEKEIRGKQIQLEKESIHRIAQEKEIRKKRKQKLENTIALEKAQKDQFYYSGKIEKYAKNLSELQLTNETIEKAIPEIEENIENAHRSITNINFRIIQLQQREDENSSLINNLEERRSRLRRYIGRKYIKKNNLKEEFEHNKEKIQQLTQIIKELTKKLEQIQQKAQNIKKALELLK